jgi:hypothetical protein
MRYNLRPGCSGLAIIERPTFGLPANKLTLRLHSHTGTNDITKRNNRGEQHHQVQFNGPSNIAQSSVHAHLKPLEVRQ